MVQGAKKRVVIGGCCIHNVSALVNSEVAFLLPFGIERALDGCLEEPLHIQTIFIWRHLSMFDISLKQPQIHSPAVTRNVVMSVRLGPARMLKTNLSHAIFFV